MKIEKLKILYVDDEASNISVFKTVFNRHYHILTAQSAAKGLKILEQHPIRLIITDQRMPNMSGIEFLKQAKQKWPDIKSILLTGYADIEVIKEAINDIGIFRYINKPFDFREMKSTIDGALQLYQLDIDKNKASIVLKEKANKFHNIFKFINDVFIRVDNDGFIEMISPSVYELFGYKPEEVIGKGLKVFMNEKDRNNGLLQIKETGSSNNFETDLYTKDNSLLHVLINSRMQRDEDGIFLGIEYLIRDVTAFKLQQNTLAEHELKLKRFLDNAPVGIALNNMQGKFIEVNREFSRFTGYSVNELNNLSYWDLTPDEYHAQEQIQFDSLEKNNAFGSYDKEYIHKNGHRYPVLLNRVKINGKNGEALIWSAVQDITKQKKAEGTIEIKKAITLLESKNKELEQFAYIVSHDLQAPLNTISSFVGLLEEECKDKLGDNADIYLNFIRQSTKRMKSLITGLLEYSTIGSKRTLEKVNCNELLSLIEDDLQVLIHEKGAVVTCEGLPEIQAYPTEMKQLFQNLIGNALKYSQPDVFPIIHISAKKQDDGWLFKFKDNGIGIDEKFKEEIFIIFQRLHNKEDYEGDGIGLAHCKKIVELHKGEIWVEPNPNTGSVFYFTIKTN
ncbi:PAS domain S-box protein [Changchengzhania lutea]|uniref:PAS domain S-box protein n=1 Tax=Changchengzhania lutea TaxID=2049305 RepID=UPI00115D9A3C|nr:PAS domain S-box protein [Changchengzhania lutea]